MEDRRADIVNYSNWEGIAKFPLPPPCYFLIEGCMLQHGFHLSVPLFPLLFLYICNGHNLWNMLIYFSLGIIHNMLYPYKFSFKKTN